MINPSTTFGKVLLVFFWGGLSAVIVQILITFLDIPIYTVPFLVVGVNMLLLGIKNYFDPEVKNI